MRQPIGYRQPQNTFDPIGQVTNVLGALRLKEEIGAIQEQRKRAIQADTSLAEKKLREDKERIGVEAGKEVLGTDYTQDPSVGPIVEPTLRKFREGKPVAHPLIKPGTISKPEMIKGRTSDEPDIIQGINVIPRPMGRSDVVEGIQKSQQEYREKVLPRLIPTFQGTGTTAGPGKEGTFFQDPARQVEARAQIIPISPGKLGKEVEEQTIRQRQQLTLKGEQEDFSLARREQKAKTTLEEHKVERLPIQDEMDRLSKEILGYQAQIEKSKAGTIDERTRNELETSRFNLRIHRLQFAELEKRANDERNFRNAMSNAKTEGEQLAAFKHLGSSGAQYLLDKLELRRNQALTHQERSAKLLGEIRKDLKAGDDTSIENAVANIHVLNSMEESLTQVIDRPYVTVYSDYVVKGGLFSKDAHVLGVADVPRKLYDDINAGKADLSNSFNFGKLVTMKAQGVINQPTIYIRAIEQIGAEMGVSQQTVDTVKKEYLNRINRIQGKTQPSLSGTPEIQIKPFEERLKTGTTIPGIITTPSVGRIEPERESLTGF